MFRSEVNGHHENQEVCLSIFPPQVTAGESAVAQLESVDPYVDPAGRRGLPWSLAADDRPLGASDRYDRGITLRFERAGTKRLVATASRPGADKVVLARGDLVVHDRVEGELDFIVHNLDQFAAAGWFRDILGRHHDDAYRDALDLALGRHLESARESVRVTAFTLLVMLHEPSWRRVAARFLGRDAHAMDDVLQETKRRAWRSLPRFRAGARFGPWAHKTVLNACKDAKKGVPFTPGDLDPECRAADEAIDAIDARDAVAQITRDLGHAAADMLMLRHGHGLNLIEVARALKIQPDRPDPTRVSTVWRHLERLERDLKAGRRPRGDAQDRGGIA